MGIHVSVEVSRTLLQDKAGAVLTRDRKCHLDTLSLTRADHPRANSRSHRTSQVGGEFEGYWDTLLTIVPGDHNICLHSNVTGGWLNTEHIKMYLDVNVGSSKHDSSYVQRSALMTAMIAIIR